MSSSDPPTPRPHVITDDRDQTAADRDRTSDAHDETAQARDDRSEARDARALVRDESRGHVDTAAASDRAGAKRDRQGSASDRRHSGDDRDAAAADRVLSALDRANLVVDGLTGAHQRAPGVSELEREVVRATRTGAPFVLAFIDVDFLKTINDEHGHGAGDQALRLVVAALRRGLREYGLVLRYGGDEFLCGMSDLSLGDADRRMAAIRTDLGSTTVSFSWGLATLDPTKSLRDLIDEADLAMYEQRRKARADAGEDR